MVSATGGKQPLDPPLWLRGEVGCDFEGTAGDARRGPLMGVLCDGLDLSRDLLVVLGRRGRDVST